MGKVFGSCGHKLRGVDDNILNIKDHNRECEAVVSTICVCDKCARRYRKWGLVLKDKKAEDKWLMGENEDSK